MIIKKFTGKTEAEATEAAKKELGNGLVIMNVREVKKKGLFSFLSPKQIEVTAALEDESPQRSVVNSLNRTEASVRFRLFTTDLCGDSSSSAAVTSICFGDRKENSPFFFTSRTFMITSPFPNSFFAASVASASVFPVNFLIIILFLVPVSVQCA